MVGGERGEIRGKIILFTLNNSWGSYRKPHEKVSKHASESI